MRRPGEAPSQEQTVELTAEMLAALPPEQLAALQETTLALDRAASLQVIERIADLSPDVAAGLRELVENFQMGRIQELLAGMEHDNGN